MRMATILLLSIYYIRIRKVNIIFREAAELYDIAEDPGVADGSMVVVVGSMVVVGLVELEKTQFSGPDIQDSQGSSSMKWLRRTHFLSLRVEASLLS